MTPWHLRSRAARVWSTWKSLGAKSRRLFHTAALLPVLLRQASRIAAVRSIWPPLQRYSPTVVPIMAIYQDDDTDILEEPDVPRGPLCALSRTIRQATLPGPFIEELMSGRPKVLISLWCGDLDRGEEIFDMDRGDGTTLMALPGDPLYCMPAGRFTGEPGFPPNPNIRTGVPVWLLNAPNMEALLDPEQVNVIAVGHVHPVLNSATVDVYQRNSAWLCRRYVFDPRLKPQEVAATDGNKQLAQTVAMNGHQGPAAHAHPTWNPGGVSELPVPVWPAAKLQPQAPEPLPAPAPAAPKRSWLSTLFGSSD
jgi:hypothetical protein